MNCCLSHEQSQVRADIEQACTGLRIASDPVPLRSRRFDGAFVEIVVGLLVAEECRRRVFIDRLAVRRPLHSLHDPGKPAAATAAQLTAACNNPGDAITAADQAAFALGDQVSHERLMTGCEIRAAAVSGRAR